MGKKYKEIPNDLEIKNEVSEQDTESSTPLEDVKENIEQKNNDVKIVNENDLLIKSIQDLLESTKNKLSPESLKQNPAFIVNTGYNFYFCILKVLEQNIKNTNKVRLILDMIKEYFSKQYKQGSAYKLFVRYEEEWNKLGYKNQLQNFKALIDVFDKVSNGKRNDLDLSKFNSTTINPEVKQVIKDYFIK